MQTARVRLVLWLTATIAAGATVLVIAGAVLLPLELPTHSTPQSGTPGRVAAGTSHDSNLPPLASFEPAWQIPLRRPLVDPPPTAPVLVENAEKPAGPAIRLIGTIVDGEHARGVFMVGLTSIEVKIAGDVVGGAKIESIDANAATLSMNGKSLVLRREKNPFDPTGESYETVQSKTRAVELKTTTDGGS